MAFFDRLKLKKKEGKEGRKPGATDKAERREEQGEKSASHNCSRPNFLIKQAWITEKVSRLAPDRKYAFIIDKRANKSEVKKAVQSAYGVLVSGVNIVEMKGKSKRLGRTLGRTSDFKKAIITLKEGHKIETI